MFMMPLLPNVPCPEKLFLFLCDESSEPECLVRRLVGTTTKNYEWASTIRTGDVILLFNFRNLDLIGPLVAASEADCFEPAAWQGKFPVQVRVLIEGACQRANTAQVSLFGTRRLRPPHILERDLAERTLLFLGKNGTALRY